MNKYIKKSVEIEAIQWTGKNTKKVKDFCNNGDGWNCSRTKDKLEIYTLEGTMLASIGDYIIKGVKGEFYPCKPDIFEKTYDKTLTLEEVKKEWKDLGYTWEENEIYICISIEDPIDEVLKDIHINKNHKSYECFDEDDCDSRSLQLTLKEHQLLTKTFRALGWEV